MTIRIFIRTLLISSLLSLFALLLSTCNSSLALALDEKMEMDDPTPPGFLTDEAKELTIAPRATAVTVTWLKAFDDLAEPEELEYKVVYSTGSDISDPNAAEKYGTVGVDWTADIDTADVTNLTITTDYIFNVLVRDKAGNTAAYKSKSVTTHNDTDEPFLNLKEDTKVYITGETMEGFTVSWTKAYDSISPQNKLEYLVYYKSGSATDAQDIVDNGTPFDTWTEDIDSIQVTGLLDDVTYFATVVVRDEVNLKMVYEDIVISGITTTKHPRIFWTDSHVSTDSNRIWCSDLDGNNITELLTGLSKPIGISVDSVGRKLYWIESDESPPKIAYANFDGTDMGYLIETGTNYPNCTAIDSVNRFIYWTDYSNNSIYKCSLDSTDSDASAHELLSSPDVTEPLGIDIDIDDNLIFWTEKLSESLIKQAGTDGTAVNELNTLAQFHAATDIYADDDSDRIYWVLSGTSSGVYSSDYSFDPIPTPIVTQNVTEPMRIAVDADSQYIFWISNDQIYRCPINTGSPDLTINSNMVNPEGLAIY